MPKFTLRPWREQDAAALVTHASNEKIGRNLRDGFPYPYTAMHARSFIAAAQDRSRQRLYAIEAGGQAVGSVGVFFKENVYRRSAEVGYWLAEPFWNQGIISRAVAQICQEVFEDTDIVRIQAEVFAYNAASCRALEKAGFTLEGRLRSSVFKGGQIHDSCMYALIK